VSNLFWINIGISFLCTLVVAASAPLIARFYHEDRLVPITLFLSTTFLLSGSTIQHQALLKRQMRFKAMALIEISSMAIGVFVGIAMAATGYRYWSWWVSPSLRLRPPVHLAVFNGARTAHPAQWVRPLLVSV
jgi:PST family polysaccharide transporter